MRLLIKLGLVLFLSIVLAGCSQERGTSSDLVPSCNLQQAESAALDCLSKIDLSYFQGEKLKEFVQAFEIEHSKQGEVTMEPPGTLSGVGYELKHDIYIEVFIADFSHQKQSGIGLFWDFDLILEEEIYGITVFHENEIINKSFPKAWKKSATTEIQRRTVQ